MSKTTIYVALCDGSKAELAKGTTLRRCTAERRTEQRCATTCYSAPDAPLEDE